MEFSPLAFMELGVILAFGIGWLILEHVAKRLERKRRGEHETGGGAEDRSGP